MKNPVSHIFTSELNHYQMLSRETIGRDINGIMHSVSESLLNQPKITNNSFRVGYMSKSRENTKDIKFIRQSIDHRKIDSK
jgi:hypothetical protein